MHNLTHLYTTTRRILREPTLHAPTVRSLGTLLALATTPDPLTQGELCEALNSSMPAGTHCVAALELAGLVERFRNPADLREVFVRLTPKGNALIRRITQ